MMVAAKYGKSVHVPNGRGRQQHYPKRQRLAKPVSPSRRDDRIPQRGRDRNRNDHDLIPFENRSGYMQLPQWTQPQVPYTERRVGQRYDSQNPHRRGRTQVQSIDYEHRYDDSEQGNRVIIQDRRREHGSTWSFDSAGALRQMESRSCSPVHSLSADHSMSVSSSPDSRVDNYWSESDDSQNMRPGSGLRRSSLGARSDSSEPSSYYASDDDYESDENDQYEEDQYEEGGALHANAE